jgi:hypothetical protein
MKGIRSEEQIEDFQEQGLKSNKLNEVQGI